MNKKQVEVFDPELFEEKKRKEKNVAK